MPKPKRLTRKAFWEHWPEVATDFRIDKYGQMRADSTMLGRAHCPVSAVAAKLGMPVRHAGLINSCFGGGIGRPAWADSVILAADGIEEGATYRRLVEHIPEGNR